MSRLPALLAFATLVLGGCSTTHFTSTWQDPETRAGALRGKTVAAIFLSKDANLRRASEVYIANDLTNRGARGVTSYSILPSSNTDGEAAREILKNAGVDAAIVMRIAGKDQKVTYHPGSTSAFYGGFGPYYSYGYSALYTPASVSTDTVIAVETLIYRLSDDKLMWASISNTTNPDNLSMLIDETADVISKRVGK
ncbi:MAG: hypothetical protein JSR36_05810 [Proteobacteria bacterium]|nr:hypothetical protein [Pseudomonadota bacterium]